MNKHFKVKELSRPAQLKLKFTITSIQTLQENLYQLSDEQLKKESDELLHDLILWLKRWFNFSGSQYQSLVDVDYDERTKLAFDLSFALESRLPVLLTYSKLSASSTKKPLNKNTPTTKISSYWNLGMLQVSLNKNTIHRNNPFSGRENSQLIKMQKITQKAIHPIITESTRFENLIKDSHEF